MKIIKVILLFSLLLTGCARQLTEKTIKIGGQQVVTQVKEMKMQLQFRDHYSTKNKLYLIFSDKKDLQVPNLGSFFLTPGNPYYDEQKLRDTYYGGDPQKGLQNVYDDYFSSWGKIILFDGNFFSFNEGPFVSANRHLQYKFNNLNIEYKIQDDTLSFVLDLDQLSLADKFYLKILIIDEHQQLKDGTKSSFLVNYADKPFIKEDGSVDYTIDGDLNLISWKINIY